MGRIVAVSVIFTLSYNVLLSVFGGHGAGAVVAPEPVREVAAALPPGVVEQRTPAAQKQAEAPAKPDAPAVKPVPLTERLSSDIAGILDPGKKALVSAKKVVVDRGDTLMELLVKKAAVSRGDAFQAVQALSKVYNPRDLNPGHEITVFFHADPAVADPRFSGVRIEKDIVNTVTVQVDDGGRYVVNSEERGVNRVLKGFKGKISSSLYVDARAEGVPDAVIFELIKMYSWNVDFQREIQPGDGFEVMYEEYRTEEGKTVPGRGDVVYARLSLSGDDMPFYRFEDKSGDVGYYDDTGRSARKPLMKTPVDGARLSSGFGMRRHPVLGFSKMHKGVDFAAPKGTPIYAAGDGMIEKVGPYSTYGNYVRIRHGNGLKTAYAHMRKFKAGLKAGARVKQGDVIGYVGTTGRSTGPHLHYEVMVNNVQRNPASIKLPTGKALKGNDLKSFKRMVSSMQAQFRDLSRATAVAAADARASGSFFRN